MDGKYSLVAGHLEENESVVDCMLREAYEEAGITIEGKGLMPATVLHRKSTDFEYMDFFFVAKKWTGEPTIKEPDKCDRLAWFPIGNLPKNTLPHVVEAIKNYQSKIPFSESGWK